MRWNLKLVDSRVVAIFLFAGFLGTSLMPETAIAEGRCPPGQYPIGGEGVGGCAPIGATEQGADRARPAGKWHTRWGAFAISENMVGAAVTNLSSKREAEERVVGDCTSRGGLRCRAVFAYKNGCAVVAHGGVAYERNIFFSDQTVGLATAKLHKYCGKIPAAKCEVLDSYCSPPEFERYW